LYRSFTPNACIQELRLADYAQGRRYGNGSGQAGAFGTSTGFGGFGQNATGGFGSTGSTGGGLFGAGSSNNTSSPFGAAQTTNTGFGNNSGTTGGGLFGAKPAGGGLFGATPTTSSQPSGGLFGTTGSTGFGTGTGTGFGSGSTGGGLFGSNSATQANNTGFKLGGTTTGGFGQSATGAFGQSNSTSTGGLFGNATATASPFGGGQQQTGAANPFGGFGQAQNQGNTSSAFGGFGDSQSQQKPGGLFGNTGTTNTGGGLFGSNANNQQQTSGGLFGNTGNNQQTGGGLFGNKPVTSGTGGGLFGNLGTNNTSNTGGSLFSGLGNPQQNQPNQGGGLFGNNQQQDKPGGLFGQTTGTTNNAGGGLFGNLGGSTNNQPPGGSSLFGNLGNNSQNPQQTAGGQFGNNSSSILGNSQQNQQQGGLLASLTDQNPYGHQSIFSGLPPPSPQNVGPIATPLSTGQKMKKSAILPQYKINPNAASRLVTPQKRGYGFTYSTYGTPSSISSAASTPGGFSNSLLGGSFGRSLGKSLSTSNLRRTFDSDSDSILAPGAFSANSMRYSNTGSLKRLTIDRTVRTDLFGSQPLPALPSSEKNDQSKQPGILKKKVSFDSSTVGGNGIGGGRLTVNDQSNGALARTEGESATPSGEEQAFFRSSSQANGNVFKVNGAMSRPEMEQVKGNELAIVHEDGTPEHAKSSVARASGDESLDVDPEPGEYYMKPSREELRKMSRDELKQLSGYIIGRQRCGFVRFDEPVDLTTLDLDDIYEKTAKIVIRSITLYPVKTAKPPRGKGLNVPATLTLENCWPRTPDKKHRSYETSGRRFDMHVKRLQGVRDANFVRYDKERGEWIFTVPHFTTYQLDYSDEPSNLEESMLSAPPYTPTPVSRTSRGALPQVTKSQLSSHLVAEQSPKSDLDMKDHTLDKSGTTLPGAYDNEVLFSEDVVMDDEENLNDSTFSAEQRSVHRSQKDDTEGFVEGGSENAMNGNQDQPVTGAFPRSTVADIRGGGDLLLFNSMARTKSILKGSQQQGRNGFGTPFKAKFDIENDWAEQLQRTVSPRKQDRQALRERQATILKENDENHAITPSQNLPTNGATGGFTTSIDLMKSLFGQVGATKSGDGAKQASKGKGFEV
jgi:nuclear pore complex protein Nup98-Nup96